MAVSVAGARLRRAPLMALAIVALFAGLWGGLIRLGLSLPAIVTSAAELHGPLMALGFLGTLVLLHRLQSSPHNTVMGLGALAWCVAAALWLTGADVARFAPLLAGSLVLTIVGERLELTRAVHRSERVRRLLLVAVAIFVGGLAVSVVAARLGMRIAGIGLIAQAGWLARYDVAQRTVRMGGVTRFMALALLAGYVWLACAGVLWTALAALTDGAAYDASLHAVFLGFVMSMVFAHAPVIVPAVLRVPLPFHRGFYAHLGLLHASLAVRLLGGDLAGSIVLLRWGGIAGEVAILLFLAATATLVARSQRTRRRPRVTDRHGRRLRRVRRSRRGDARKQAAGHTTPGRMAKVDERSVPEWR